MNEAIEAGIVQCIAGLFLHDGFCMISNACTGCRHHFQIVGTVADGNHMFGFQSQLCRQRGQKISLGLCVDNMAEDVAGKLAANDFQRIGACVIEPGHGLHAIGKEIEATGNQQGFDAMLLACGDPFQCAGVECQPFVDDAVEGAFVEAAQQLHPATQAFCEFDLSAHGTFRDFCHFRLETAHVGDFVDALDTDQG